MTAHTPEVLRPAWSKLHYREWHCNINTLYAVCLRILESPRLSRSRTPAPHLKARYSETTGQAVGQI